MSKLELLKNDYFFLCEEFERASNYMHSIGKKIREKRKEIDKIEPKSWFKYKGKVYHVLCIDLIFSKSKSYIYTDKRNGSLLIIINSKLTLKEKQKELHMILKRKKSLKYFGGKYGKNTN